MALKSQSSFLFGFEVTALNSSLDFRAVSGGPVLLATLRLGFYSLSGLLNEVKRALEAADPTRVYTPTANRAIAGGTENRVTILSNGTYFDLLFATGPRTASTVAPLIGFATADQTGALTYTGTSSAGTIIVTERTGYNYKPFETMRKNYGAVSVSASGVKEGLTWAIQEFAEAEFKHEPEAKVIVLWRDFIDWAIQQREFEFTPEIDSPQIYSSVTLESTAEDGRGLAWTMKEMLSEGFPFWYGTGVLKFRRSV